MNLMTFASTYLRMDQPIFERLLFDNPEVIVYESLK
jgi:hypothetical protein